MLDGTSPEDLFLGFEWFDAIREAHGGGEETRVLVGESAGETVAVWPLRTTRRRLGVLLPWRSLREGGSWYVPHNGIAAAEAPERFA